MLIQITNADLFWLIYITILNIWFYSMARKDMVKSQYLIITQMYLFSIFFIFAPFEMATSVFEDLGFPIIGHLILGSIYGVKYWYFALYSHSMIYIYELD